MTHQLVDFYLDLHSKLKGEESLQTAILSILVKTLILAGGEGKTTINAVVMSINEFPRAKGMLTEMI